MMNQSRETKKWWRNPYFQTIGILLLFVAISLSYFYPAVFEGRSLFQADGAGASGVAKDVVEVRETTGESPLWTGSQFGGMPMYQISPWYPSLEKVGALQGIYQLRSPLNLLPGDSYLVFMLLLGFFIFMRSWGATRSLSVAGAVMWAFSSYFLILIDAGHIWKLLALCYIPPTIGGLVLAFRQRKYLLAFVVTAFFTALQILSNHIQMSYYFLMLMIALVIGWGIEACKNKECKHYAKALLTVVLAGTVGVLVNITNIYHTYQYTQETMRGGSVVEPTGENVSSQGKRGGLDKEYITQWSYGIDEMLTFLIPDAKGGFSSYIGTEAQKYDNYKHPQSARFVAQQNRYWGDQPFTAGPVYVGAFVLALAIFGFLVARGPLKWAVAVVTLLTIALSWGRNMMWLTDLFIDWVPLYNKFRTVSSILVVAEMTLPMAAVYALYRIGREPEIFMRHKRATVTALLLTAGVTLLVALFPSVAGSLLSAQEKSSFDQYIAQKPELGVVVEDLEGVRAMILSDDAWRSLVIILIGCALILAYHYRKVGAKSMVWLVALLVLVDLWSVDKRYLNDSKYLPMERVQQMAHTRTAVDDAILADTTQYRVMNLTVDTFNDATTSHLHRSVGGYHAAKLQRYQDVITTYLLKQDLNVLRALNTKYYIVPDSVGTPSLVVDDQAYGAAWFVEEARLASSAKEELEALGKYDLSKVAVLSSPFSENLPSVEVDSTAVISVSNYAPDAITYRSISKGMGLAVFSEIYYPEGWIATIDGEEAKILRVDYLLRALVVPAGEHEIRFEFRPSSVRVTETIAHTASYILLGSFLLWFSFSIRRRYRKQQEKAHQPQP